MKGKVHLLHCRMGSFQIITEIIHRNSRLTDETAMEI